MFDEVFGKQLGNFDIAIYTNKKYHMRKLGLTLEQDELYCCSCKGTGLRYTFNIGIWWYNIELEYVKHKCIKEE